MKVLVVLALFFGFFGCQAESQTSTSKAIVGASQDFEDYEVETLRFADHLVRALNSADLWELNASFYLKMRTADGSFVDGTKRLELTAEGEFEDDYEIYDVLPRDETSMRYAREDDDEYSTILSWQGTDIGELDATEIMDLCTGPYASNCDLGKDRTGHIAITIR